MKKSRALVVALPPWERPTDLEVAATVLDTLEQTTEAAAYCTGKVLSWAFRETGGGKKFDLWLAEKVQRIGRSTAFTRMLYSSACDEEGKLLEDLKPKLCPTIGQPQPLLPLPDGKFRVIVADPPWPYGTVYDPESRRVANPYPELSIDELKAMKVSDRAAEDAFLWLWTTNSFIRDAFDICEFWGFTPKTILTWDKVSMGIGAWLRGRTEHCILATVGAPTIHLTNETTLLVEKRRQHSRKPEKFYKLVEKMCPAIDGERLEIFSRTGRKGWVTFGNETNKFEEAG
jgi:N6-adenosine-specific RNA methylase IME4